MKVTALIPDELVKNLKELADGDTLTDALILALTDWTAQQKIKQLNQMVMSNGFKFKKGFSAEKVRNLSRKVT